MLSAVKVFFWAFFAICRLAKGPQDIPESKNLLILCLLIYSLCSSALIFLFESPDRAIIAVVLEIVLIMIFTQALLQIRGKSSRWLQTVTAIFGAGIVISLIALPVYLMIDVSETGEVSLGIIEGIALLLLQFWNIVVMAHILRHALEITYMPAVVLGIAYIWIIYSFTSIVIPTELG